MTTTKRRGAKKTFRILDMEHASFWDEKKKLPRFLYPFEHALDPCAKCPGFCCYGIVHLTMVEALGIALTLSLPIESVVDVVPAGERGGKQTVPIPLQGGDVRLVLKHATDADACVFLHRLGERGVCSVHALRPGACRQFPYTVEHEGRTITAGPPAPCPTRWLWDESTAKKVRADLVRWLDDIDEEKRLVAAWKRRGGDDRSFEAFARFSIERLAPRYGKDAADLLAPPRRRLGG